MAATTGLVVPDARMIGAEIEAAVVMATVPEPCTKRMRVEMKSGRTTSGIPAFARAFAS